MTVEEAKATWDALANSPQSVSVPPMKLDIEVVSNLIGQPTHRTIIRGVAQASAIGTVLDILSGHAWRAH